MTAPSVGTILYLGSCAVKMAVSAATTYPDTPNQYTASFKVMSDVGFTLDAASGPQGPAGQGLVALREQTDENVTAVSHLPTLSNTTADIGKYYLIDELDSAGHILTTWCYIWWGTYYRQIMMGTVGPPGSMPEISIATQTITPGLPAAVSTSGGTWAPGWDFEFPSPVGAPGPNCELGFFPDVNVLGGLPANPCVLASTGGVTADGYEIWTPFNIEAYLPKMFSMPMSQFRAYSGIAQQANVGSYTLPPQPYPWTPVVWGHLSAGGFNLSGNPLMVGAQVLLSNSSLADDGMLDGQRIGRGMGARHGVVNISPHYSTPKTPSRNIKPANGLAVIPASPSNLVATASSTGGSLPAATYYYVVTAVNADTETPPSAEVAVTTKGTHSKVTLSWIGPPATGYNIYRGTSSGAENVLVQSVSGTTFSIIDSGGGTTNTLPPPPTKVYVNLYNDGQYGYYTFNPTINPNTLQSALDALVAAIGHPVATIKGTISLVQGLVAGVPQEVQNSLDAIASLVTGNPVVSAATNVVTEALNGLDAQVNILAGKLTSILGFSVPNLLSSIASNLASFSATLTADLQNSLDAVANQIGIPGISHTPSELASVLNTIQPTLQQLSDVLGGNWIPNVVTLFNSFISSPGATITTDIRTALDAATSAINQGTGLSPTSAVTALNLFQQNLDGVANKIGLTGANNTISSVMVALVPWINGAVSTVTDLQTKIDALANFLGLPGLGNAILSVIDALLALTGNISTYYTTDAQLFIMVVPMLANVTPTTYDTFPLSFPFVFKE